MIEWIVGRFEWIVIGEANAAAGLGQHRAKPHSGFRPDGCFHDVARWRRSGGGLAIG